MKVIYIEGGGKNATHNYVKSCNSINWPSHLIVQIYSHCGNMLMPLVCKSVKYFHDAPSFLFLHAENLIILLHLTHYVRTQSNLSAPGLCLAHNLDMLTPSQSLVSLLDKVAPEII